MYRPPQCSTVSLPELAELLLGVMLEPPQLLVLEDFSTHAEAALSGVARDFMFFMTTMGLSKMASGPTHAAGHTLDLVSCTGVDSGDLGEEECSVVPLSWTDHYLVGFMLTGVQSLCRSGGPTKMVHARRLMGPNFSLIVLGEFTSAGNSVKALADFWIGKMPRAIDTISPKSPLP